MRFVFLLSLRTFPAGYCCPTTSDVYLDCCDRVYADDFEGVVSKEYALATIGYEEALPAAAMASTSSGFDVLSSVRDKKSWLYLLWLASFAVAVVRL